MMARARGQSQAARGFCVIATAAGARYRAPFMASPNVRSEHGWWPYLLPYFAFLGLGEIQARLSPDTAEWLRALRVATTALLLLFFVLRGAYPELRGYPHGVRGVAADVAAGLVGLALWIGPYLLIPALPRPAPDAGFDPNALGDALRPLVLSVRGAGFALVTPVMEELFVRSFLPRYADVFDTGGDFRKEPVGRYTRRSFWVVMLAFTLSHAPWEWPVAVAWCALANAWLYQRKHIGSVIVLHAATNGGLFLLALGSDSWRRPLWWLL